MQWWRGNGRTGVALAAFAMLLQLALSFGHVHLHDLAPPTQRTQSSATALASAPSDPSDQQLPAGLPDDDGDCPICIAMHMASSGVLPVAPLVVLPDDLSRSHQQAIVHFDIIARRHSSFQTRAPPAPDAV